MIWIIVAIAGIWMALSAFILLIICMNSARLSQMEEQRGRLPARARSARRRVSPKVQPSTAAITGD